MSSKLKIVHLLILLPVFAHAQEASLLERSYEYVKSLGQAYAPSLLAIAGCVAEEHVWECAREKAGKMLDAWQGEVDRERRSWGEAADLEVRQSGAAAGAGRAAAAEPPSRAGGELEASLQALVDLVQNSFSRAMARKKGGGGIDTITLSTTSDKKKMKKKKKKPQKIQIVQAHPQQMMMMLKKMKKPQGRQLDETRRIPIQSWVIGHQETPQHVPERRPETKQHENHARNARDLSAWTPISIPLLTRKQTARKIEDTIPKVIVSSSKVAKSDVDLDNIETKEATDVDLVNINSKKSKDLNSGIAVEKARGIVENIKTTLAQETKAIMDAFDDKIDDNDDLREVGEQRGKKKKKKKAILKLLLLGAVAKAKIGLLLQILSAKLQVKFFLIALAGLAINVARFWLDLKKGGQPQKVIYYEHAQHQHHYEHEDDEGWSGGSHWSRSLFDPKEPENIYPTLDTEQDESTPTRGHSPYRGYGPHVAHPARTV